VVPWYLQPRSTTTPTHMVRRRNDESWRVRGARQRSRGACGSRCSVEPAPKTASSWRSTRPNTDVSPTQACAHLRLLRLTRSPRLFPSRLALRAIESRNQSANPFCQSSSRPIEHAPGDLSATRGFEREERLHTARGAGALPGSCSPARWRARSLAGSLAHSAQTSCALTVFFERPALAVTVNVSQTASKTKWCQRSPSPEG
jgi:hypothetical protein